MSIAKIYSDQSRRVDWTVREITDATLTITVTDGGAAYNTSSTTFIAEVFKIGSTTALLTLSQGSGITNGGATGIITLSLTDTQLTLTPNEYFWKLRTTAPTDYLWLNGKFTVNGYTWDGGTDSTATIALTVGNNTISLELITSGGGGGSGDLLAANNLSDVASVAAALNNLGGQGLIITETTLTDAATIDIAQQNNTLATSRSTITFTISNTSTFIYLTITLTGTSLVLTFPANSLCVSDGTASGDNTCTLAGASGDKYEIAIKKRVSTYSIVSKNFGQ